MKSDTKQSAVRLVISLLLVGALLAFVIEFFHIREALAGLIRFAGRVLLEALRAVWGLVRSAWSSARAMAAN